MPMNRVVLCGRLAARPQLTYTPCGLPVARFRLRVPREDPDPHRKGDADPIDCLAFRGSAVELATWGEEGVRVNLEGRLRSLSGEDAGQPASLHVLVDYAYCAE